MTTSTISSSLSEALRGGHIRADALEEARLPAGEGDETEEELADEVAFVPDDVARANAEALEELEKEEEKEGGGNDNTDGVSTTHTPLSSSSSSTVTAPSSNAPSRERRTETLSRLDRLLQQALRYTEFLADQLKSNVTPTPAPAGGGATSAPKRRRAGGEGEESAETIEEEILPIEQPPNMTGGKLKPYQLLGFQWLKNLWENGLNGILADEMGLGKTVQTIALLSHLRAESVYNWTLIVVPLSTITNWISEFNRWNPHAEVVMYHGSKQDRAETIRRLRGRHGERIPVAVVTTFEIVCRDRRDLQGVCKWNYLVVDEGHRLKNHNCRLLKELNALVGTGTSCSKLLLTGTPLQNNIVELWSLLNFLLPDIFDDLEFFTSVFEFDPDDPQDVVDAENREQNVVAKLHRILQPFMMRRLKSQVERHLPPKKEIVVYCEMDPSQRELYDAVKRGELAGINKELDNKRSCMNILMQLRKASNHPYLIYDPTLADRTTDHSIVDVSGKMRVLDSLLAGLRARGHKVLIFSQFTTMLDIIDDYLTHLRPQYKRVRLDGSTHFTERQGLMNDFNDEKSELFVFLLSTRAGGVGINLISADTVILFDSDWNPHVDNQANDRVHRIGQKRPVVIYRLISTRSAELKILERANMKRKLERVICATKKGKGGGGGAGLAWSGGGGGGGARDISVEEIQSLLEDDFTGHRADFKGITLEELASIVDRNAVFADTFPTRSSGYEVAMHKASTIVGGVNDAGANEE